MRLKLTAVLAVFSMPFAVPLALAAQGDPPRPLAKLQPAASSPAIKDAGAGVSRSETKLAVVPLVHAVAKGEYLGMIAGRYGVDWQRLFDANPQVRSPNLLYAGQLLRIPSPGETVAPRSPPVKAVVVPRVRRPAQRPVRPAQNSEITAEQRETNRLLGRQLMLQRWGEDQWPCLDELWGPLEAGWNHLRWNQAGSGAYGIPQALPADKMASQGTDWQTNPAAQIRWGLGYIAGRYGTPCEARAVRLRKGSY